MDTVRKYSDEYIAGLLPWPASDSNKYTRGRLVLIAGANAYPGAAILASMAAQRTGAGYTEVYVEDKVVPTVQAYRPSLVVRSWSSFNDREMKPFTEHHPCAYVVGPGFDVDDQYNINLTRRVLRHAQAPVLVDGSALHFLSARKLRDLCDARYHAGYPTIITPHGGEAASLAKIFEIPTDDPEDLALLLSRAYGATVVLKGPDTYITDGDGIYRMSKGTPALAKAGTGDVLSGVIGALLAQGLKDVDACILGTVLHARAGALAAEDYSEISVCAEEVVRYLPDAVFSVARPAGKPGRKPPVETGILSF